MLGTPVMDRVRDFGLALYLAGNGRILIRRLKYYYILRTVNGLVV